MTPRPGPRNCLTDVAGLAVGHAEDHALHTGVTVVVPDHPTVAAVDVRGGGPGTRETDALAPESTVQHVHAVALSGGSAYGLDAAGGAMDWLRRQGRGFAVGPEPTPVRVPIVPCAILFDLLTPAPVAWEHPPWWDLGRRAAAAARPEASPLGNVGAGLGAVAGALKGGIGTASFVDGEGEGEEATIVAALVAVNALGSAVMPGSRCFWTWWLEQGEEAGGQAPPTAVPSLDPTVARPGFARANTTLAVVATDAILDRPAARRFATMAHDGLARALRPAHAPLDGDTVFALATGARPAPADPAALSRLGTLAADALSRAIMRAVVAAEPLGTVPAWRDLPR